MVLEFVKNEEPDMVIKRVKIKEYTGRKKVVIR